MAEKCANCDLACRRGKLLRCLHVVCLEPCLGELVAFQAILTCPRCGEKTCGVPGLSLERSLPDSLWTATDATDEQPTWKCQECGEDEEAIASCTDCDLKLCSIHSKSHPRSRTTLGHKIDLLPLRDGACKSGDFCLLHPSLTLSGVCLECSEVFCERCRGDKHSEHAEAVLPLSEAVSSVTKAIAELKETGGPEKAPIGTALDQAIENVSKAIEDLHAQSETVSAEVTNYFATIVEDVRKRERQVLADLDKLRNEKLIPLEQQKQKLSLTRDASNMADSYLGAGLSKGNFCRVSGWLKEAVFRQKKAVETDSEPCVESKIRFKPANEREYFKQLECLGDVADVALGESTCQISCNSPCHPGQQVKITVRVKDQFGKPASEEHLRSAGFTASVILPSLQVMSLSGELKLYFPGDSDWYLAFNFQAEAVGDYTFQLLGGGKQVVRQPFKFRVVRPETRRRGY